MIRILSIAIEILLFFYLIVFFCCFFKAENDSPSLRKSKSIHDLIFNSNNNYSNNTRANALFYKQQIHTDACIQTMGLDEPENFSLKHINGKLKIHKPNSNNIMLSNPITIRSSYNTCYHKSTENLNGSNSARNKMSSIDCFIDDDDDNNDISTRAVSPSPHPPPPPPLQSQFKSVQNQPPPFLDYSTTNNKISENGFLYRPNIARTQNLKIDTREQDKHEEKDDDSLNTTSQSSSCLSKPTATRPSRISPNTKYEMVTERQFYQPKQLVIPQRTTINNKQNEDQQKIEDTSMISGSNPQTRPRKSSFSSCTFLPNNLSVSQNQNTLCLSEGENSEPLSSNSSSRSTTTSNSSSSKFDCITDSSNLDFMTTHSNTESNSVFMATPNIKPRVNSSNIYIDNNDYDLMSMKNEPTARPRTVCLSEKISENREAQLAFLAGSDELRMPKPRSVASLKKEAEEESEDSKELDSREQPTPRPRYDTKLTADKVDFDSLENDVDNIISPPNLIEEYSKEFKNNAKLSCASSLTSSSSKVMADSTLNSSLSESMSAKNTNNKNKNSLTSNSSSSTNSSSSASSSLLKSRSSNTSNQNKEAATIKTTTSQSLFDKFPQTGFVNHMKSLFETSTNPSSFSNSSSSSSNNISPILSPATTTKTFLLRSPLKKFNSSTTDTSQISFSSQINSSELKQECVQQVACVNNKNDLKSQNSIKEESLYQNVNSLFPADYNINSLPPPPPAPQCPPIPPPLPSFLSMNSPITKTNENMVSKILSSKTTPQKCENLANLPPRPTQTNNSNNSGNTSTPKLSSNTSQTSQTRQMSSLSSNSLSKTTTLNSSISLPSNTTNNNNSILNNEFRLKSTTTTRSSERSTTPSSKSVTVGSASLLNYNQNGQNKVMISHLNDIVDEVKLQLEGERRIFVPGYMTTADVLRNVLLNRAQDPMNSNSNNIVANNVQTTKPDEGMTLKEKLVMKQRELQESLKQPVGNFQHSMPSYNYNFNYGHPTPQMIQNYNFYNISSMNNVYLSKPFSNHSVASFNQSTRLVDRNNNHFADSNATSSLNNNLKNKEQKLTVNYDKEDEELAKKFNSNRSNFNSGTRSNSGMIHLPLTDLNTTPEIIDLDLNFNNDSNKKQEMPKPNQSNFAAPTPPPPPPPPPSPPPELINEKPPPIQRSHSTNHLKASTEMPQVAKSAQNNLENNYASVIQINQKKQQQQNQPTNKINSIRTGGTMNNNNRNYNNNNNNSSRRVLMNNNNENCLNKQETAITGSFDPNDFDSFDEGDNNDDDDHDDDVFYNDNKNENIFYNVPVDQPPVNNNKNNTMPKLQHCKIEVTHHRDNSFEILSINNSNNNHQHSPVQIIDSVDKIREEALRSEQAADEYQYREHDKLAYEEQQAQHISHMIQNANIEHFDFDPEDFDSFDEDEETKSYRKGQQKNQQQQNDAVRQQSYMNRQAKKPDTQVQVVKTQTLPTRKRKNTATTATTSNNNGSNSSGGGFLRSALDRISLKSKTKRSSSVPLRTLLNEEAAADLNNLPKTSSPISPRHALAEQPQFRASQKDRSKSKSISMPDKNNNSSGIMANMKTLQIMNKFQSEYEEKQKKKKLKKREKQLELEQHMKSIEHLNNNYNNNTTNPAITPKTQRKLLNSIMNTLFSSQKNDHDNNEAESNFNKNETKRLSLKKLKMKDKTKKQKDQHLPTTMNNSYQSDNEYESKTNSSQLNRNSSLRASKSMNLISGGSGRDDDCLDRSRQVFSNSSTSLNNNNNRVGKIRNEDQDERQRRLKSMSDLNEKENLMRQLQAELDEEIKDRQMLEHKMNIINQSNKSINHNNNHDFDDQYYERDEQPILMKNSKPEIQERGRGRQLVQGGSAGEVKVVRSKSVTFLENENEFDQDQILEYHQDDCYNREEEFCGSTVPPKRSIIKTPKSNDLNFFPRQSNQKEYIINYDAENNHKLLPQIYLQYNQDNNSEIINQSTKNNFDSFEARMINSQTTPNIKRREINFVPNHVIQSDL